ncbi:MAG: hypothetical protein O2887_06730 [Bacteroidetes bacterium]|nr:hypothetical protein [Bacteroidota bacterium]MDA1120176.1 hypothetical protein [Bacteroidota bacterium]
MIRKTLYVLIAVTIGLGVYNLIQNKQIKELRKIQDGYVALTANFAELSEKYRNALAEYNSIKDALDETNYNLDSVRKSLQVINEVNGNHLITIDNQIDLIIATMDTSQLEDKELRAIVDLGEVLGN